MDEPRPLPTADTAQVRKARGAFFTPAGLAEHLTDWAVRHPGDRVLEPSAGEAVFLEAAVRRLTRLGADSPLVHGVEIHPDSAVESDLLVRLAGGRADIRTSDFFLVPARAEFDAVIGNPPYIRYQDWTGAQRDRARLAALEQGVTLSGLASSWAAFVVHSAGFLKPGGRLGLVLPAELLTVNYAAPVRRFLLENFRSVELVVFEEQVFPDAEADTVLLKAAGWGQEPSGAAVLRQARDARTLASLEAGTIWIPTDTTDRWAPITRTSAAETAMTLLRGEGDFVPLQEYGETSLGAVTGNNKFFTLSPQRVRELRIPPRDLVRISPPGSAHLRGLDLTPGALTQLGRVGSRTWLLYPSDRPSAATRAYLDSGEALEVHRAYKCRVRKPWWRVPVLQPPDLFLTYMNGDTARLTSNMARARHLNSVHGVYLKPEHETLGQELLPLASLNSMTMLSAELVGRSYGGGILKIEPREADGWWMPSPTMLERHRAALVAVKTRVQRLLKGRRLDEAAEVIDAILLTDLLETSQVAAIRKDLRALRDRRTIRGSSRGRAD